MAGMDARIRKTLEDSIAQPNGLPGLVFGAIDRNGRVLVLEAAGKRSLKSADPMTVDTVFPLFSITKLLVAIAALQLVEQGKIPLDDPLEDFFPPIKEVKLLEPNGTLRLPRNKITMRMLLTHTAGFGYTHYSEALYDFWKARGGPEEAAGTRAGMLDLPLTFEPGTSWAYGVGMDWAGEVVAHVAGTDLADYCETNILRPLGIRDITFTPTEEQRARLAGAHRRGRKGPVEASQHPPFIQNALKTGSASSLPFISGGSGGFATAPALLGVLAVLLRGGMGVNGERVLKEESVHEMVRDQLAETMPGVLDATRKSVRPAVTNDVPADPSGSGWGLSFQLNLKQLHTGRSAGSAMWGGLANLYYSIDPTKGIATVMMAQCLPFFDPHVVQPWLKAEKAVYESLTGTPAARL
ncbi:beta-lactamase/transpeptidase-like protein [Auricularia subglabra TFB-10046 SS5]|uniref:Beta-lactamase/transpeptidase-like protein n=1 Tax=Auricularia subglabra (strain TFB-10046 / SS5) TaxID=717982 RepID=J0DA97_AURST|nr:beta-lactamase/transpeptidase-like protein [Auricularia subglabra TFB-10046 SS5]